MSESSNTNRRKVSTAWENFKMTENSQDKAKCLYCRALIGYFGI